MEIEKKQLLKRFLFICIPIEILLILSAVLYSYVEAWGAAEALVQLEQKKMICLLTPVIFAILAALWFLVIWKWKSQKK